MSALSICIPTYRRPQLLLQALASCETQSVRPLEVLIGDDSPDDETEHVVRALRSALTIRYVHHRPSLGQSANVEQLFRAAEGKLVMLLHDDDFLLPEALARLLGPWRENPAVDASFGRQAIANEQGEIDPAATDRLNAYYGRTHAYAGVQRSSERAGVAGQFPNDGYIVRRAKALAVGYASEYGDACDYVFGVRYCRTANAIVFVDELTSCYRESSQSIARGGGTRAALERYLFLKALWRAGRRTPEYRRAIRSRALMAAHGMLDEARYADALRAYVVDTPLGRKIQPSGIRFLLRAARSVLRNLFAGRRGRGPAA